MLLPVPRAHQSPLASRSSPGESKFLMGLDAVEAGVNVAWDKRLGVIGVKSGSIWCTLLHLNFV